jgi:diaminopimelate decarboxylase
VSGTPVPGSIAPLAEAYGTPLYVYDEAVLRQRCRTIRAALPVEGIDVLYALKANSNPAILGVIREEGLGADAVSLGEVLLARRAGFPRERISFNGNNVDDAELAAVLAEGVHVCVDALSQLERLARLGHRGSVAIRLNPDIGAGHHGHVITGGPDAKFGIAPSELPAALAIARKAGLAIDGVQQHIGSGILDAAVYALAMEALLDAAAAVPDLRYVDFGGGFGVPSRPEDRPFDFGDLARRIVPGIERFRERVGRQVEIRLEPGRFVVAECGTLLVRVTAVKRTQAHVFVGTDSGFHHLVRPILYGAFHRIENLTNPEGTIENVCVAGNICESGDLFAIDRPLPQAREGDLLAIRDAGAYGYSMASTYNSRPRPAEVMVRGADHRLIRRRETFDDLWRLSPRPGPRRPRAG